MGGGSTQFLVIFSVKGNVEKGYCAEQAIKDQGHMEQSTFFLNFIYMQLFKFNSG